MKKVEEAMEYRKLPHGEEQISIIGMGSSVIGERSKKDIMETVEAALVSGYLPWRSGII